MNRAGLRCLSAAILCMALCHGQLSATAMAEEPSGTAASVAGGSAAPGEQAAGGGEKYALRYQFRPGETVRWKVVHRAKVNTTISGTTQTAETMSVSVKSWRLISGSGDGPFTFEHSVESIDMRQKLTGREEVTYNSATDTQVPPGFEQAAQSVGVPLAMLTLDAHGQVLKREDKRPGGGDNQGQVTVPLPDEPIAVGHTWSFPYDIAVSLKSGEVRQIKTRQQFTLQEVQSGIATIGVETQVLSPIHDPAIEAQLVQRETAGKVRFDIKAGRIIEQQMDLDKNVIGFSGEASSLHYVTRFTEELLPPAEQVMGPAPPPAAKSARKPTRSNTGNRGKPRQSSQPVRRR